MARYRYRTPVLTGPWRGSRSAAIKDAVGAKQALFEEDAPDGVRWLVPGEIEEQQERGPAMSAQANGR